MVHRNPNTPAYLPFNGILHNLSKFFMLSRSHYLSPAPSSRPHGGVRQPLSSAQKACITTLLASDLNFPAIASIKGPIRVRYGGNSRPEEGKRKCERVGYEVMVPVVWKLHSSKTAETILRARRRCRHPNIVKNTISTHRYLARLAGSAEAYPTFPRAMVQLVSQEASRKKKKKKKKKGGEEEEEEKRRRRRRRRKKKVK